jgi:putative flippase GtrA
MNSIIQKFASNQEVKYLAVGAWNTAISWLVFLLVQLLFVPPLTNLESVLITYLVSVANSYGMQRAFVWKSKSKYRTEFPKFIVVSGIQLLLNLLLIRLFVDHMDYPAITTQLVITIFLIGLTYVALKNWTFKR